MEDGIQLITVDKNTDRCAYCEVHAVRAVRRNGDDLIPLCILCGAHNIHIGCISKLETSMHGYLRCANAQCHRLFSEHYNHNDINIKQLKRQWIFYRLTPVLWLLSSAAFCAFLFLYDFCSDQGCFIAAWIAQGVGVLTTLLAFFGKVQTPAIYLKLSGSRQRAYRHLMAELVLVGAASLFGILLPILTLKTLFMENVGLACWIFAFHLLCLPIMMWKTAVFTSRMIRQIGTIVVSLDAVSIVDLRDSQAVLAERRWHTQ